MSFDQGSLVFLQADLKMHDENITYIYIFTYETVDTTELHYSTKILKHGAAFSCCSDIYIYVYISKIYKHYM